MSHVILMGWDGRTAMREIFMSAPVFIVFSRITCILHSVAAGRRDLFGHSDGMRESIFLANITMEKFTFYNLHVCDICTMFLFTT